MKEGRKEGSWGRGRVKGRSAWWGSRYASRPRTGNPFGIARLVQSREWEGADILGFSDTICHIQEQHAF